jgi:Uma2 family endonuclease
MLTLEDLVEVDCAAIKRFTVAEYHELQHRGMLDDGKDYELLDGWLVEKMTQETPHASAASKLDKRLWKLMPDDRLLRSQKPITLRNSEPEPDAAVCIGPEDRYDERHPSAAEIEFVVEVADSSLRRDQTLKLALYASARIREYWIVNLIDRRVEVYTHPRGGKKPTYRTRTDYLPGSAVPVVLGGTEVGSIAVDEILPKN